MLRNYMQWSRCHISVTLNYKVWLVLEYPARRTADSDSKWSVSSAIDWLWFYLQWPINYSSINRQHTFDNTLNDRSAWCQVRRGGCRPDKKAHQCVDSRRTKDCAKSRSLVKHFWIQKTDYGETQKPVGDTAKWVTAWATATLGSQKSIVMLLPEQSWRKGRFLSFRRTGGSCQ